MRRTRYVALPVRAWQYVGLLVVSLACLTLGLVSRDKEGRAGSLAGPEMEHQAPHEVDACPNWSPFTELPSTLKPDQGQKRILKMSGESRNIRTTLVPANLPVPRSRNVNFRSAKRLARQEWWNVASDFSGRSIEFRLGTRNQDGSFRRSSDPAIRFSSTIDHLTNQRLYKRSTTDMERRAAAGDSNRSRRSNEASREPRFLTLTRSMERVARERNNVRQDERSLRNVEARSRIRSNPVVRRDSRLDQDRRSFARSEERRERRFSRSNERLRSTIDDSEPERRERANRLYLVREKRESQSQSQTDGTSEAPRANSEESRGGRLTNRRRSVSSSRRASERRSVSLESRNRKEIRAERRSKERRSDRRVVEERFNHRSTEQKLDRRLSEPRSERRSTEQTTADRRLFEQRSDRRRVEQRFDRRRVEQRFNHRSTEQRADRRLPEQRSDRRNVEQIEQRFNHRSTEQRSDRRLAEQTSDRRLMEQRFNQRSTESGFDRRLAEKKLNRRLAEQRFNQRSIEDDRFDGRSTEEQFHRQRTEQRLDDRRRSILQRYHDVNRLQRTRSMPQLSLRFSQKEHRLTDSPSDDSAAFRSHARSSRVQLRSSYLINNRFLESREKLSNRNNDILSRTNLFAASDILKEKNSMKYALTFEIIRQALVVALCIMYSLSLFHGKRSIVSNLVRQAPRFILW